MSRTALLATLALSLALTPLAHAISLGQIDTFQIAGDTLGWTGERFNPPTQIATGGPLGAGDGYLQLFQGTPLPYHVGSKNSLQWAGDYLTAGVGSIEMDISAMGPDQVDLRLLIFGAGGTWASTDLTPTTIGGGWMHYTFSLNPSDLVHVTGSMVAPDGTGVLADTLSGVTTFLIRHDRLIPTIPGDHPPHITSTIGIDNIEAAAPIPEPWTLILLIAGGAALALRRRA